MKIIRQELWEVLVPVEDNDGMEIPLEHHQRWDELIRGIAGGLTIMKTAKGQWLDSSGELFAERMIPVRVACDREQVEQIMGLTAVHYDQLAVMAYRISEETLILERQ